MLKNEHKFEHFIKSGRKQSSGFQFFVCLFWLICSGILVVDLFFIRFLYTLFSMWLISFGSERPPGFPNTTVACALYFDCIRCTLCSLTNFLFIAKKWIIAFQRLKTCVRRRNLLGFCGDFCDVLSECLDLLLKYSCKKSSKLVNFKMGANKSRTQVYVIKRKMWRKQNTLYPWKLIWYVWFSNRTGSNSSSRFLFTSNFSKP